MSSQKFAIRLSVEDAEKVRAALQGMGASGAGALKVFGDAADKAAKQTKGLRADASAATPAMRTLDNAAKGVGDAFTGIANRIPVIGPSLAALGPAGLAAAAGIAAIGGAFFAMNGMAQKSREYLDDIATQAANMSTSAETYQTLTALAIEQDIEFNKLAEAMNKLQLGAAMAAKGQGELYSTLKRVKPELVDVLVQAETQEDRWDALSRAISGTENQLDKVAIAKAAFGEKGAQFIRMLEGEDKTIAALTDKYKGLGLVIEEDLVAAIAAADTRLDLANKRMEIDGVRAGAAMLPVIEGIANAWNGAQIALGSFIDNMNALENRQTHTIFENMKSAESAMNAAMADWRNISADLAEYEAKPDRSEGILRRLREAMEEARQVFYARQGDFFEVRNVWNERTAETKKGAVSEGTVVTDPAAEAAAAAAAAKAAAEAARQRAEAERELNKALAERNAAQAKVNAILDAGKTPVQRAYDELDALIALYNEHGNALEGYAEAYTRVLGKISEAEQAERKLAEAYVMGADAFGRSADAYEKGAESMDRAREASFELRFAAETLGGIFDQNIETLEDLGAVALRVFRQMAIEAMIAQSKIAGSSFLQIIGAAFGFGGGGAGAGGPKFDPATLAYDSYSTGGSMHTGGVVGDPTVMSRMVPSAVFAHAPRFHAGLAPDEFPTILQRGERVLSAMHNERLVRAIEGGGSPGGVKVVVNNHTGEKAAVNERQSADGGREIEITIGRAVDSHIASGRADNAMASRYGVRPKVR